MEHYDYYHRVCEMSSDLFGGYKSAIDIRTIESNLDIIQIMKARLIQLFESHNLPYLINEVNKRDFHIHSHTFEDVLTQDSAETIVYICDHCSP
jgi:hypothetical protein